MIKKYIENIKAIALFCLVLSSCGEVKRVDTKAVKAHINDYKIKKVDQSTIVLQAETWSQSLADTLEKRITKQLKSATSPQKVAQICALSNDPWIDSLAQTYAIDVVLWGKNTQIAELKLPQEQELLGAYQYALEKQVPLESNLQKSGDSLYVFTRTLPGIAKACWADSSKGLGIVRFRIPKAAIVKSLPFRKK